MKFWLRAVLCLGLLAALFIFFLPALLNTPWAQKKILAYANNKIPGQVTGSFQVSWGKGLQMQDLLLCDRGGHKIASLDTLECSSLVSLLLGRKPLTLEFKGLNAKLSPEALAAFNTPLKIQASQPWIMLEEAEGFIKFPAGHRGIILE